MSIQKELFGKLPDGREVYRYILKNDGSLTAAVIEWGGALQQLSAPDREGRFADLVCGFADLASYLGDRGSQGALVGRFANRIADAVLEIDGVSYPLEANEGKNHIHGGPFGFARRLFEATPIDGEEPQLVLHYLSRDGEEGYPGNLDLTVRYTLKKNNALQISYFATTDRKTAVNLTNHAYFNLGGFDAGKILDHELWIDADAYLPLGEGKIPTGEIASVENTPFDFRAPKPIGRDLFSDHPHLAIMGGYDTCFCFTGGSSEKPILRAVAFDPKSGREMKVYTDQPCLQLYTANGMKNAAYPFKNGVPQVPQTAFCMETQGMPDSVHKKHFFSPWLSPGEAYAFTTEYAFSIRK